MKRVLISLVAALAAIGAGAVELYSNGTYVTGINTNGDPISESLAYGTGPGGATNSTAGFNFDKDEQFAIADNFTVPGGQTWDLQSMKVYGYQTQAAPGGNTSSTITAVYVRIYSGDPRTGGTLVAGDTTTNRLISSNFSGAYRVFNGTGNPSFLTNKQRPVMENLVDMSWVPDLPTGQYFVAVSTAGSLLSGPWWVPTTETNGNYSVIEQGGSWSELLEEQYVNGNPQNPPVNRRRDMMFKLDGNVLGGAQIVNPTTFTLGPGIVVSGNLASLLQSDDNWLVLRPGIVFSTGVRPISMILEGNAPGSNPSSLQFVIESHGNQNGINERVEVFNFNTNSYDAPISSVTLTTTDVVKTLAISNPSLHIGPGNLMRVRVSYAPSAPVFAYPWLVMIDETTWRFTP